MHSVDNEMVSYKTFKKGNKKHVSFVDFGNANIKVGYKFILCFTRYVVYKENYNKAKNEWSYLAKEIED